MDLNIRVRAKRFLVSPLALQMIFAEDGLHHFRITQGIPEGATIADSGFDTDRHCFYMVVLSDQFEAIEYGDVIPLATIEIKDLRGFVDVGLEPKKTEPLAAGPMSC